MEAGGVYTEPVYYALGGQGFEQVAVINPAHAKALKGHKTDAKDALRLAELFECGLLRGSYIPSQELKDLRDLTRYRIKTVQARTAEIQRLAKALGSAGIKLDSVVSDLAGKSATLMIEALIDGERRGRGAGGPGDRPDAHRWQAGGSVPGADGPVRRAPRGAVPAAPGPDRAVRHGGRRPGAEDRRHGHPLPARAGPAEIDRRVRPCGSPCLAGRDRPGPA